VDRGSAAGVEPALSVANGRHLAYVST
jgi:hypothetical protein